jgi:hypothetical protein
MEFGSAPKIGMYTYNTCHLTVDPQKLWGTDLMGGQGRPRKREKDQ